MPSPGIPNTNSTPQSISVSIKMSEAVFLPMSSDLGMQFASRAFDFPDSRVHFEGHDQEKETMKPGKPPSWGPGGKSAVGTALSPDSCVWFTMARGCITETFYP